MSNQASASDANDSDRLIRIICVGGFSALLGLTLFVHLLLIYRA